MGKYPSIVGRVPQAGCWITQNADMSPVLGQKYRIPIIGSAWVGEWMDCDCLPLGLCMPGEPPLPPIAEFLVDPRTNPGYHLGRPEDAPQYPAIPPDLHTGREDPLLWPHSHEGVYKRGFHDDANTSSSRAELRHWQAGKSTLPVWGFSEAVVRAFHVLEPPQQRAILYYWPNFAPIVKDLKHNFNPITQELDPRPVMAILLGVPSGPGGDVVRLMDRKWVNFLAECVSQSFARYSPAIQTRLGNVAVDSGPYQDRQEDPRTLAAEYLDVYMYYKRLWRSNLPSGIYLDPNNRGKFMISYDGHPHTRRIKSKFLIPHFFDTALGGMEHNNSFVADVDDIVASVHQQLDLFNNTNPFLRSMAIEAKLDALEHKLDWSDKALHAVFSETLPQLQMTMGLFSLSMWAGLGSY